MDVNEGTRATAAEAVVVVVCERKDYGCKRGNERGGKQMDNMNEGQSGAQRIL
jgi:hypothetical protein